MFQKSTTNIQMQDFEWYEIMKEIKKFLKSQQKNRLYSHLSGGYFCGNMTISINITEKYSSYGQIRYQ